MEAAVTSLPPEEAKELWGEVLRTLKTAEPASSNLSHTERCALLAIKKDETSVVLKSDKGNTAVILETAEYRQKMNDILEDSAFGKLKRDPTAKIERTVTKLLKATEWTDEIKALLITRVAPCIYGLPK